MAGFVFANGAKMVKPAQLVKPEAKIEVRGSSCPYVSRGGLKLQGGVDTFHVDLSNKSCLDLGASTGGFTDFMLTRGAAKVTSVDVGKGQLHWKLRTDDRVHVMEKTNARHLKPEDFQEPFDFLTGDLSFIGLHLILPAAFALAKPNAEAIFLVKPQFEAGRKQVGRGGVVRDPNVHLEVLQRVIAQDYTQLGFQACGVCASPLKGPAGNIEYLLHYRPTDLVSSVFWEDQLEQALTPVKVSWQG